MGAMSAMFFLLTFISYCNSYVVVTNGMGIPATPGGGGVGPPTENGLSIFDPDDALATV